MLGRADEGLRGEGTMKRTILGYVCIAGGVVLAFILSGLTFDGLALFAATMAGIGLACLLWYAGALLLAKENRPRYGNTGDGKTEINLP